MGMSTRQKVKGKSKSIKVFNLSDPAVMCGLMSLAIFGFAVFTTLSGGLKNPSFQAAQEKKSAEREIQMAKGKIKVTDVVNIIF